MPSRGATIAAMYTLAIEDPKPLSRSLLETLRNLAMPWTSIAPLQDRRSA